MVARRPWPVLILALASVALFASRLPHIVVDTSTEGFLHPADPTLVAYDEFRERFGRDDGVVLGIETENPFTLEFLERLRAFQEDIERNTPFVDEVTSLLNARWTRGGDDQLIVEDLVAQWPTGDADLAELRRRVYDNPLYLNNLINADGRLTTVMIDIDTFVQTGVDENGAPIQRYLSGDEQRSIVESIRQTIDRHQGPGFEVHAVGVLWMADRLAYRMVNDIPRLVRRGLLLMALILVGLFGTIRGVTLPLLVVVCSLIVTLGSLPLLGMPYQLPTQVVMLSLLAIGIGDSIHVLAMYYHYRRNGRGNVDALADAFGHAGSAILITSLTTAGALISFIWAEVAPISNLGVLLPIGVTAAFVYTLTILPALLVLLPVPKKLPSQRGFAVIENGLRRSGLWAADHPAIALGGAAVVLLVSLLGVRHVRFAHDPMHWFPRGDAFRESTLLMNERLGGVVSMEFLFDTGEDDGVKNPALLATMDDLTARNPQYTSDSSPVRISKTISIVDLLKEVNRALHENRASSYRLPESRELVAQELLLFELSGSDDLEDLADYQYRTARMTLRTPWVDATKYGPFTEELLQTYRETTGDLADVELTGRVPLLTRTMSAVVQSMSVSYVIAFAAVVPLMMLFLGSVRLGSVAMIPNLLPLFAALGLMGWCDFPLDVFSLLTGSITLGVAVDDTIHFMHGVHREMARGEGPGNARRAIERTLAVTGQALFSTSLILCCGFGLYATAYMRNMVNFGFVTAFALAVALLADVIVGPALVAVLEGRRETRAAARGAQ